MMSKKKECAKERQRIYRREWYQRKRLDSDFVRREKERNAAYHRDRCASDPEFALIAKERNAEYQRKRRKSDPEFALMAKERRAAHLRKRGRKPLTREQAELGLLRRRAKYQGVTLAQFLTACPSGYAPRKKKP